MKNSTIVKVLYAAARLLVIAFRYLSVIQVLLLIRLYQVTVSGKTTTRRCRFTPSCSEFAYQAFYRYGLIRGLRLTRGRLARCNPRHAGGYDPVP
jgi:putative membrane protein insertion efficiency factor